MDLWSVHTGIGARVKKDMEKLQDFEKALLFLFVMSGEVQTYNAERQCKILARLAFNSNVEQAEAALEEARYRGLADKR